MRVLCFFLFVFLVRTNSWAQELTSEESRLLAKKNISRDERQRLNDIFFLTSRCDDLRGDFSSEVGRKKIQGALAASIDERRLYCFCKNKNCEALGEFSNVIYFRSLLREVEKKRYRWSDKVIQQAYKKVRDVPEAQYMLFRQMLKTPRLFGKKDLELRQEIEKSLKAFGVES